jgi:hypothetical protein
MMQTRHHCRQPPPLGKGQMRGPVPRWPFPAGLRLQYQVSRGRARAGTQLAHPPTWGALSQLLTQQGSPNNKCFPLSLLYHPPGPGGGCVCDKPGPPRGAGQKRTGDTKY